MIGQYYIIKVVGTFTMVSFTIVDFLFLPQTNHFTNKIFIFIQNFLYFIDVIAHFMYNFIFIVPYHFTIINILRSKVVKTIDEIINKLHYKMKKWYNRSGCGVMSIAVVGYLERGLLYSSPNLVPRRPVYHRRYCGPPVVEHVVLPLLLIIYVIWPDSNKFRTKSVHFSPIFIFNNISEMEQ